ncbi:Murein DD-endopeptidase MepM/ murein hydrolase activator NlpD OS=Streptomyces griseomycini OX=66895 GN=FHS37_006071 PE=3 SV=1 [Streptomyces griseomycini]
MKPHTTPQSRAGRAEMYTVIRGNTLSGIAADERVRNGWRGLYEANASTIGADPDLIVPGQRLALPEPSDTAAKAPAQEAVRGTAEAVEEAGRVAGRAVGQSPEKKPLTAHRGPRRPRGQDRRWSPQVSAALGTPYHKAGSAWSKGYHTGIDFPVPTGTSVKSVAASRVVSAGWEGSFGYQVVVRHADGRYSQYAHLSAMPVKDGQSVVAGQRIGRSGSTGNSSGPHPARRGADGAAVRHGRSARAPTG